MAVFGYSMTCDRLVPIRPVAQKWGSKVCDWAPLPHDSPHGGQCLGTNKVIR